MINKLIKVVKKPSLILLKLDRLGFIRLSDELFLKLRFKSELGYKLNLDNPKTFNEKLQWLKLHDRNPNYGKMVDKYEVRKYISETLGEDLSIPLLGVYDKFEDIDFNKLPNQFVIKCTHDSGGLVICKNKDKLDYKKAKKKIEKSLKRNYFYPGREWPYKNLKPRIIIEKYMVDNKVKDLIDYKIMCFNGEPLYTFVYSERFSDDGVKATFFDKDWNILDFKRKFGDTKVNIKKPINYDKMLEYSKKIAQNIPFVRIDWYEVNGKLYFGEITFFPSSGFGAFNPQEWDLKLGNQIKLPRGE